MNPVYECSICGKETFEVDMDYLIGTDHLACHIKREVSVPTIKLENWEKLDGVTFHTYGCELVIADCKVKELGQGYEAWIYQTKITPSEALMRIDLWYNYEISLKVFPPVQFFNPPIHLEKKITKEHIKNPSIFLSTVGQLILSDSSVRNILTFYQ